MDGRPRCETSEEQILTAFNHGREEMRFLRNHEWRITNYALIAFAALAIAPELVDDKDKWEWLWRHSVSVSAFFLVVLAGLQAGRVLWYTDAQRKLEHRRLLKGIGRLEWIDEIENVRPLKRSQRPKWVRLLKPDLNEALIEADSGVHGRPGLHLVVVLAASFANVIILSRMSVCVALTVVIGFVLLWGVSEIILTPWGQRQVVPVREWWQRWVVPVLDRFRQIFE